MADAPPLSHAGGSDRPTISPRCAQWTSPNPDVAIAALSLLVHCGSGASRDLA
jgi:hypothetical protein